MKSKKGFTLIELLAVIVILAIIALITVPIVIRIIDNAKKGAAEDSTYGVIETARLFWVVNQSEFEVSKRDMQFTCGTNGECKGNMKVSIVQSNGDIDVQDKEVKLDIDGTKPKAGTIDIDAEDGKVTVAGLKFGDYTCSKTSTATKVTCS